MPAISNGQALSNIYGKILRFNLDGTVPADNPFVNIPGAVPAIYAYGLRNPFRFTFLPDGQAMTENTGSSYWEDLDTIQPGGNYGWDYFEGNCFSCGYLNPTYAYGHYPVDGAASAIAAYSGSTFPNAYDHVVFFGDYNRRDIEALTFDPSYQTETSDTVFDTNAGTIADLLEGPDGNLYFVGVFEGTLNEITAPGPFPPTAKAAATPSAGPAPLTVQFSAAGSSDPYGKALGYSWDFGDGSTSTSANPSHVYTSNGTYTTTLTVTGGSGQTAKATTTVVVGQSPPTASITRSGYLQRRRHCALQRHRDRPGGRDAARVRLHVAGGLHQQRGRPALLLGRGALPVLRPRRRGSPPAASRFRPTCRRPRAASTGSRSRSPTPAACRPW